MKILHLIPLFARHHCRKRRQIMYLKQFAFCPDVIRAFDITHLTVRVNAELVFRQSPGRERTCSRTVMSSAGILMVFIVETTILLVGHTAVRASVNVEDVFHRCGLMDDADSDDQSLMDTVSLNLILHTPRHSFNQQDLFIYI